MAVPSPGEGELLLDELDPHALPGSPTSIDVLPALLAPGGLLAVCDIVKRDDDDRPLLLTATEQLKTMGAAGLRGPRVALVDERLGLFVGRRPDGPDQRPVPAGLA